MGCACCVCVNPVMIVWVCCDAVSSMVWRSATSSLMRSSSPSRRVMRMQVATSSFRERAECILPPTSSPVWSISFDSRAMCTSSYVWSRSLMPPSSTFKSPFRMDVQSSSLIILCLFSIRVCALSTRMSALNMCLSASIDDVN